MVKTVSVLWYIRIIYGDANFIPKGAGVTALVSTKTFFLTCKPGYPIFNQYAVAIQFSTVYTGRRRKLCYSEKLLTDS
jgi:hypothetical protein